MTELAKLMFNCTRGMAMLTANMLAKGMHHPAETSYDSRLTSPMPEPSMSSPFMSLMAALYPAYWLKLAAGMLERLEIPQSQPARRLPAPSVLDKVTQAPETLAPAKLVPSGRATGLPSGPPASASIAARKITGWGPMP